MNPHAAKVFRHRPRTLRVRIAARTGAVLFACLILASAAAAVLVARAQTGQVETVLRTVAASFALDTAQPGDGPIACQRAQSEDPLRMAGLTEVLVEVHGPAGEVCRHPGSAALEPLAATRPPLAWVTGTTLPRATRADGTTILVLVHALPQGWSIRIGGDLGAVSSVTGRLVGTLLGVGVIGALLAAGTGIVVARNSLRPLRELAEVAQTIAATQDPSVRIDLATVAADDEIGRLAGAFDRMTTALAQARERQGRLIADAGHELRTPLTSLRGNVQLLLRSERTGRPLPAEHRDGLLADIDAQLEELSRLVGDLARLAPAEQPPRPRETVRLDALVERAVTRVARRGSDRRIDRELRPWLMADADAEDLERAVVNLLDNAAKFSPPGSVIRVGLDAGRLTVDDEGPGVPVEQRELAFERFWRADGARSRPGSGLGLAIVAAAAARHAGTARLERAPSGGTRAVLELPGSAPD
jgi:two-component system sensor histidine kinase MprB